MAHYYSPVQTSEFKLIKFKARLRGKDFEFFSAPGVFSGKDIDKGTELLIDRSIIMPNWEVLDMGCGYGAVGIAAAGTTNAKITMCDINERAIKLTKMNIELNKVQADVKQGDLYSAVKDKTFDAILVNPPYCAGRETCFKIIDQAKLHLKPAGFLQLVARHQKGGKTLEKHMQEVFGNVRELAKGAGYRVYISKNS